MLMTLWQPLCLTVVTAIADQLELCLRDYAQGGFLPPHKRALRLGQQKRFAQLAHWTAGIKALDQYPELRNRLLVYANVLNNKYPALSQAWLSAQHVRKG